jgi:hypothetical protein
MQFTDAVAVAGKPRRTADGYLVAEARCVRTGIQLYAGDEVGKPEMQMVRVYRPEAEVFADAALQSFTHAPVTNDHPAEMVTADNWRDLAVGEVSTAAKRDGEWVMLPLILKDAAAIQAVEGGKRELSAGYTCTLQWGAGTTPAGEAYDAIQTGIKINHLALVDRARAGSAARIGDGAKTWGPAPLPTTTDKEPSSMSDALRTVIVDGLSVSTTDQGAQAITTLLQRIADAATKASQTETAHIATIAAKDAELAKKDAQIDDLNKKVLDQAAIDKLVADRAGLVALAGKIAKDVKTDGLSDADIRKAVVTAKLGDAAVKDKPQAYIDARFDILAEDAGRGGVDPFRTAARDGITPSNTDASATLDKAYGSMVSDMQSAWQNPNGKAA